jgi:mono/diheme cytochrome c family protein
VAEIIYEHCASCHHENGIGPFPLMTYADLVPIAWEIKHQVEDRHMPPWPADPNYRHFAYENYLSDEEIAIISQWVLDETPIGKFGRCSCTTGI